MNKYDDKYGEALKRQEKKVAEYKCISLNIIKSKFVANLLKNRLLKKDILTFLVLNY